MREVLAMPLVLETLIRMLLFIVAMLGYAFFLRSKLRVKSEFVPVVIFSGISVLMFAAGLLNVLMHMAYLITGTGLFCFIWFPFKSRSSSTGLKRLFSPGMAVFLAASAALLIVYRYARLLHYDDFSHWGLIVRQMIQDARLPNGTSDLIKYRTYPPGSALFIYYVLNTIGYGRQAVNDLGYMEGKMLFAQGILIFSCLLPLFAFIKTRRKGLYCVSAVVTLTASVFILTVSVSINALLVDTLLPLLAFANSAILIWYRNEPKRAALLSLPLMILTLLVKNSGLVFFAANALLFAALVLRSLYRSRKEGAPSVNKRALALLAVAVMVPLLLLFLWSRHTKLVFEDSVDLHAKHSMTLSHYRQVYAEKDEQEVYDTVERFIEKATDLQEPGLQTYIAWNVLLILQVLVLRKRRSRTLEMTLIFGNLMYAVYQAGSLAMYLFSMPGIEAIWVVAYDRYHYTVVQYLVGLGTAASLYSWGGGTENRSSRVTDPILGIVLTVALCFPIWEARLYTKLGPHNAGSIPIVSRLDQAVKELDDPSAHAYTIYAPSSRDDFGYVSLYARYALFTSRVTVVDSFDDEDSFWDALDESEFFIVLEEDDNLREWMEPFGERESYIGIY